MVGGGRKRGGALATALSIADAASWTCALALVVLILVSSLREPGGREERGEERKAAAAAAVAVRGGKLGSRACEEIYVVGEGETLHTISDKCGDPFIVERNPHIHDPDDVFPGLVIMLTPANKPR
ncbi:uncharacterized protein LOC109706994 [Ananas comosus]|uniref:Uncharacterized protein LOC109706994 n=1 Tax=Ananas comosus TaxID=4615 RepID=A0A199W5T5_ANACO|nr:uncharacterized protein LOC109706994 [Ananas comosus]OAY84270.1 hypothetical protein ACMD2_17331 [Ananas comosus]